ncbi:MAG: helix-turn-helix domain-containing protein [Actinomycetota bacterium]|nr:helix-turn-helix domain-containing protein [Actinomycetota bacterium]
MTKATAAPSGTPVNAVIGQALRRRRIELGKSQDAIARQARLASLSWNRPTVSAIESGDREVSPGELFILMTFLDMNLADVFGATPKLLLTRSFVINGEDLVTGLKGETSLRSSAKVHPLATRASASAFSSELKRTAAGMKALTRAWPQAPFETTMKAEQSAAGETEQKGARKLGVHPIDVALTAYRLWDRSLTEERDARVASPTEVDTRALQALRGHTTRKLLEELAAAFPPSLRPKTAKPAPKGRKR